MTDKAELNRNLHRLLAGKARRGEFSGVVRVQQDEDVWFQRAYGQANRAFRVRNRLNTGFRVASVSKMFTAVAVLQLVDAGKLSLESRAVDRLDLHHTRIPAEVTVSHLLTMTAGIADWFEESGDWAAAWEALKSSHPIYRLRTNRDYLDVFANREPVNPVGSGHQYSNSSYILLGLLIEAASGESYFDYVRRCVFAPAGMEHSGFFALDEVVEGMAEGYEPALDANGKVAGWKRNIYETTPIGAGDGGAVSTADDLVRFLKTLRAGRLLSSEMTAAMLTPQVSEMNERFRGYEWLYGYGNAFLRDDAGRVVRWGHPGEESGVSCRLFHYPQADVDVVILGNQSDCAREVGWWVHDWITRLT